MPSIGVVIPDSSPALVGAPVVEPYAPLVGTAPARFYEWVTANQILLDDLLDRLLVRWRPMAAFLEVHFIHPELGPAGTVVASRSGLQTDRFSKRADRLAVIPFSELTPYLATWREGGTVLLAVEEVPEPLRRRYAATPIRWSLNCPVVVEESWVGLVGAVAGAEGFEEGAVRGFEALAQLVAADYGAEVAWRRFQDVRKTGQGALRLLP